MVNKTHKGTPLSYCCLGVGIEACGFDKHSFQERLSSYCKTRIGLSLEAENKLISMNDGGKHNFRAIARWIEKNL